MSAGPVRIGDATVHFVFTDDDSPYAVVEWTLGVGGTGTPVHVHRDTDETFYVLEGTFSFLVGEQTSELSAGGFTRARKGLPHAFWNPGSVAAKLLMCISPGPFVEYFRELAVGLAAGEPAPELRRRLSERYDVEIVGPPVG